MSNILREDEIENLLNLCLDDFMNVVELPDGYDSEIDDEVDDDGDREGDEVIKFSNHNTQQTAIEDSLIRLLDERDNNTLQLDIVDKDGEAILVPVEEEEHIPVEVEEDDDISTADREAVPGPSQAAPIPVSSTQRSRSRRSKQQFKFRKCEFSPPDYEWQDTLPPPPVDEMTPLEYFKFFFTDKTIELITEQTNEYARQKHGIIEEKYNSMEIEQMIGILLHMGICKMPSVRLYWSNTSRFPPIADVMSRNRFFSVLRDFHVADNQLMPPRDDPNRDKLYKVRPLLNSIKMQLHNVPQEEFQAVDEQIIPFKGRSGLKQYLKCKPHKWGFKVFTRAGASGIMYDFELYTGKNTCPEGNIGFSGDIVLHLCETIPEGKNYKIFADNWFSSLPLSAELQEKQIHYVGTVQKNRMSGCPLEDENDLKKRGRGSFDYRVETTTNTALVRWYDRKAINFISSYKCVEPLGQCRRYSAADKKFVTVERPTIVEEYNHYMGGVDLVDMLLELYRVDVRSNKWYMRIVFWCLNVAVVNGWLIHRRHEKQRGRKNKLSLAEFHSQIAFGLTQAGKNPSTGRKRGRPSLEEEEEPTTSAAAVKRPVTVRRITDVRLDEIAHVPDMLTHMKKGRCKQCINSTTQMWCQKCKVHLCLTVTKKCFHEFHRKK